MRFARIGYAGKTYFCAVEGDGFRVLTGPPWAGGRSTSQWVPESSAKLLAPTEPSKIVCVGRNYAEHARELGHAVPTKPMLFLKAPSALLPHRGTVLLPRESERVEHEVELAVVIGKRCRRVPVAEAHQSVFGYTLALDVTARDLQKADVQFARAKGFDTFCPLGPAIVTDLDVRDLTLECLVNGVIRQSGHTSQMLFDVATLVSYISQSMTLLPGDVILTGTPEGVGPLAPGDVVQARADSLPLLEVSVSNEG